MEKRFFKKTTIKTRHAKNFFQEGMVSVLRKFCDSISEKNLPFFLDGILSSRSQSEIVVPVFNAQKNLIAVLDIDATEKNQFDEVDQKYLEEIVRIFSEKRNK